MNDLSNKFCTQPWHFMVVGDKSSYCCCWQLRDHCENNRKTEFDLLNEWNVVSIQEMRRGVLDGSFKMCNKNTCFNISSGNLCDKSKIIEDPYWKNIIENNIIYFKETPSHIHFNFDLSCNLKCPICRGDFYSENKLDNKYLNSILWNILEIAKKEKKTITLSMCGCGEPFFSKIFRNFLFNADLRDYSHIKIGFNTNGIILTEKTWNMMEKLNKNIEYINWSIEGSTKEIYDKCRVGGNFNQVVKNIDFINKVKKHGHPMGITLCYVVYKHNYKDMKNFIKFVRERWDLSISFNRYSSRDCEGVDDLNIFDPRHSLHLDFLDELKNPIFKNTPNVYMTNVTPFLPN